MSILKDISELVSADIISPETADSIRNYYLNKKRKSPNRLYTVFAILGAILTGLGIILIIAHNWDDLSKNTKTIIAFFPLIAGQLLCAFTLLKKKDNNAWRESSAAFLFFAVGASISLISQIYNISGDLSSFMLTWMLLCLPLIYIMRSSVTSLLYIIGITFYAIQSNYRIYPPEECYYFWLLFLLVIPYYFMLYKEKPESNYMIFHNWLVPLSLVITLGTVAKDTNELMYVAYTSLFGLYYQIGNSSLFKDRKPISNGYAILGSVGTLFILLALSFDEFWDRLRTEKYLFRNGILSPELIAVIILTVLAAIIFYRQYRRRPLGDIKPIMPVFILFIPIFVIGLTSTVAVVLINLLVFAIGILTIGSGAKKDHLGILNFGLIIIMILVACRFFDTDMTFVTRGILFICVGTGFFITNYLMLKKRKENV